LSKIRVWMVTEASSFGRALQHHCNKPESTVEFANSPDNVDLDYFRSKFLGRKEIDIFDPTLPNLIGRSGADVIVFTLPFDAIMSEKYPDVAIRYNIEGLYKVISAAKTVNIPVIVLTTAPAEKNVFYDVAMSAAKAFAKELKNVFHFSSDYVFGPEFPNALTEWVMSSSKAMIQNHHPDVYEAAYSEELMLELDLSINELINNNNVRPLSPTIPIDYDAIEKMFLEPNSNHAHYYNVILNMVDRINNEKK
jgi:hypothetical protein